MFWSSQVCVSYSRVLSSTKSRSSNYVQCVLFTFPMELLFNRISINCFFQLYRTKTDKDKHYYKIIEESVSDMYIKDTTNALKEIVLKGSKKN